MATARAASIRRSRVARPFGVTGSTGWTLDMPGSVA
jgi:hypothetical protein